MFIALLLHPPPDSAVLVFAQYVVLETEAMGIIHEDRKSKQWISDIKYSPDGFTLAIGSHDNTIYLHDVNNSYTVRAMCTKHNSFITHFDFSMDSATLQSNCGGYELLFCTSKMQTLL